MSAHTPSAAQIQKTSAALKNIEINVVSLSPRKHDQFVDEHTQTAGWV